MAGENIFLFNEIKKTFKNSLINSAIDKQTLFLVLRVLTYSWRHSLWPEDSDYGLTCVCWDGGQSTSQSSGSLHFRTGSLFQWFLTFSKIHHITSHFPMYLYHLHKPYSFIHLSICLFMCPSIHPSIHPEGIMLGTEDTMLSKARFLLTILQ